jgi:hypothetical protein
MGNDEVEFMSPKVTLGEWVIYSEGYFYFRDEENASFKTKKEAIEEVSLMKLDARKNPKVKKIRVGCYEYFPKDVDSGEFGESFIVEKVDEENINKYTDMIQEQMNSESLNDYE